MLARRLTTVLPVMTVAEALETTRIPRVAGRTDDRTAVVTTHPCRAPYETVSDVGLIGGGPLPRPGEVSVALEGYIICIPGLRCRPSAHMIGHRSHPHRPLVIGSSGSGGMINGRSYRKPLDRSGECYRSSTGQRVATHGRCDSTLAGPMATKCSYREITTVPSDDGCPPNPRLIRHEATH